MINNYYMINNYIIKIKPTDYMYVTRMLTDPHEKV